MKQKANATIFLGLLMSFIFIACNSKAKKEDPAKTDETKIEAVTEPGFDPAMDATKMAGYPARVLKDTLNLKAYEFVVNPGDTVPMHSHPDNLIYVLEGGTAEITAKGEKAQIAEFVKGSCLISGPATHSAKNIGTTAVKLLIVHVYRPRS